MHASTASRGSSGSLHRVFLVLFVGFTLVPFALLFYLFARYGGGAHRIGVSRENLGVLILLVGAVCLIGFFAMLAIIGRIARLSRNVREALAGRVDRETVRELSRGEGEVGDLARSFNEIILRLEDNIAQLHATKRTLHEVMTKVARALASMETVDSLLRLILETASQALGTRDGAIFGVDDEGTFSLKAWQTGNPATKADVLTATAATLERVRREARLVVVPAAGPSTAEAGPFVPPLICVPLNHRGRMLGVLCLAGGPRADGFTEDEMALVQNLGSQIAISFENARLNQDHEQVYFETMAALALAVEARDPYSHGHSEQVGWWAERIGRSMELDERDLRTLRDAARLHDVGKIGITDSILRKPGRLDEDERSVMNRHPLIGENIVAPLRTFQHLLDPIRHHHERLDGSGYPDGLKGEAITRITRIMMVADICDALRGDRPYRKAMTWPETRAELDSLVKDGKIDGAVVDHLYRVAEPDPVG